MAGLTARPEVGTWVHETQCLAMTGVHWLVRHHMLTVYRWQLLETTRHKTLLVEKGELMICSMARLCIPECLLPCCSFVAIKKLYMDQVASNASIVSVTSMQAAAKYSCNVCLVCNDASRCVAQTTVSQRLSSSR